MSFPHGAANAPALIVADGTALRYGELSSAFSPWHKLTATLKGPGVVLLFADNSLSTVLCYLACLDSPHTLMLADPALNERAVARILSAFQPDLVVRPPRALPLPQGYLATDGANWRRARTAVIDRGPALLLMTSGSTGAPRVVCLSADNLSANADSIGQALAITEADRAITSLPLHYCYGLSVLNSHLSRGASVVLTNRSPTSRLFLRQLAQTGTTALAGVPITYQALWPVLRRQWPATLRALTQSGGVLGNVADYARLAIEHNGRLFVMYGQTEATARMAVLDTAAHPEAIGSVGRAVPGGKFELLDSGEIVYQGPNVMLGYADTRADLTAGDRLGGVLRTGDLGSIRDGYLYLRGRIKRIAKVAGKRINLDELESTFRRLGTTAVVESGGAVFVHCVAELDTAHALAREVCADLGIPPAYLRIKLVDNVPHSAAGKIDYQALIRESS
ncbi:AMP-binding protein [Kribbella speibonae]|uniref:AMP-binding protein n=1 Tax=Kribbella speibonae TaxID=1572660 RepID=UPI0013F42526|nr:AMP-binding protein [Kribbella speibonae]